MELGEPFLAKFLESTIYKHHISDQTIRRTRSEAKYSAAAIGRRLVDLVQITYESEYRARAIIFDGQYLIEAFLGGRLISLERELIISGRPSALYLRRTSQGELRIAMQMDEVVVMGPGCSFYAHTSQQWTSSMDCHSTYFKQLVDERDIAQFLVRDMSPPVAAQPRKKRKIVGRRLELQVSVLNARELQLFGRSSMSATATTDSLASLKEQEIEEPRPVYNSLKYSLDPSVGSDFGAEFFFSEPLQLFLRSFSKLVSERLAKRPFKLQSYRNLICAHFLGEIGVEQFCAQVISLLKRERDLLDEFRANYASKCLEDIIY